MSAKFVAIINKQNWQKSQINVKVRVTKKLRKFKTQFRIIAYKINIRNDVTNRYKAVQLWIYGEDKINVLSFSNNPLYKNYIRNSMSSIIFIAEIAENIEFPWFE